MPAMNSQAYKNIQTVVAQLFVATQSDNDGLSLQQIAEVIKIEAGSLAAGGLEFIYNVISSNEASDEEEEDD